MSKALIKELRLLGKSVECQYTSKYHDHIMVRVDGSYYGIWSVARQTWVD